MWNWLRFPALRRGYLGSTTKVWKPGFSGTVVFSCLFGQASLRSMKIK